MTYTLLFLIEIDMPNMSGYTVGTLYMNNLSISAAEMTQYLSSIRMSGTNALTKKYRVPYFNYVLKDKIVIKYLHRSERFKEKSLTQYIRYQIHISKIHFLNSQQLKFFFSNFLTYSALC